MAAAMIMKDRDGVVFKLPKGSVTKEPLQGVATETPPLKTTRTTAIENIMGVLNGTITKEDLREMRED